MKALILLSLLAAPATNAQSAQAPSSISFYVSPTGSDRNPGTESQPFATLSAAQAAVQSAKGKRHAPGPITVWIHGGLYVLSAPLHLTSADSGTPDEPVIYRAVPGETPRLFGGRRLDPKQFTRPVASSEHILDPQAASQLMQASLSQANAQIDRYPEVFRGNGGLFQLLFDDHKMPLARWPKSGYTTMASVIDSGITPPAGGTFVYRPEVQAHAERWAEAAQRGALWLTGFWRVPFQVDSVRVRRVDTGQHTINLAAPVPGGIGSKYVDTINGTRHGSGKEQYYAFNLPEEIARPGEWSYDFTAHTLYFWPPVAGDLSQHELLLANLAQPVILLDGASDVHLEGLTIEGGLHEGIQVLNGSRDTVAGCTLRNIGGGGIDVEGGVGDVVQSNDLMHLGSYGIRLVAGDRKALIPGSARADNNHIFAIGEEERITEAIFLGGVGNRATHNLIHDAPYNGIKYEGNDQLMAYNEIHHVGLDAGDLGIFYTNGDWAALGNRIEYNFGHDSPNANGSYIDDGASGRITVSNLFYKLASGIFLGGGHNNVVESNLFIDCRIGIHIDNRGVARRYDKTAHHLTSSLNNIDPTSPPWSTRYPNFLTAILQDPTEPTGNIVVGNAILGATKPYEVSRPVVVDEVENPVITVQPGPAGLSAVADVLAPGSALLQRLPHFPTIPLGQIGLYIDQYRTTLPSPEATGRFVDRQQGQRFDSNQDVHASDKIGAARQ